MEKSKIVLLAALVIFFTTLFVGKDSFAKDNSEKGIPSQIEELQKQMNSLSTLVSEQQQLLKDLTTNHNQEINMLNEKIQNQNMEIHNLATKVNEQEGKIAQLEKSSKDQDDNLENVNSQLSSLKEYINQFISVQYTTFKTTIETQINQILKEISELKNNPPVDNPTGYKVSGKMVDVNGKPFHLWFSLRDPFGKRFAVNELKDEGTFTLENVPNGTYSIKYYFSSYQIESPQEIVVDGKDVNNIVIKLAVPTYSVAGKALSNEGLPLTNKDIYVVQGGGIVRYPQTSSDGSFKLDGMVPGKYILIIGNHLDPSASMEMNVTDQDMNDLVVQGIYNYKISGKLVDSEGKSFYTFFTLIDENNKKYPAYGTQESFVIPNLSNGKYKIKFVMESYQSLLSSDNEIVINGSNIDGLEIKINAPTYSASGKVIDKSGSPLGSQGIVIYDSTNTGWGGMIDGKNPMTNPDGSFKVTGLLNGTYIFRVGDPNNPVAEGEATINNGNVEGIVLQGK